MTRTGQRGRMNLVSLILLIGVVVGVYCGIKFIPIYLEKNRISRLVKAAANDWVNVNPNLEDVRKNLQYGLQVAEVKRITAEDVQFAQVTDGKVQAWVDYSVTVKHPFKQIKPTVLKFHVVKTGERTMSLAQ